MQILIGRSDDPHIHIGGVMASHPDDLMFLKNTQQTCLQLYRHLPNLIQKDGPVVGSFEQSGFASLGGSGKCAGFIAEQFALQQ